MDRKKSNFPGIQSEKRSDWKSLLNLTLIFNCVHCFDRNRSSVCDNSKRIDFANTSFLSKKPVAWNNENNHLCNFGWPLWHMQSWLNCEKSSISMGFEPRHGRHQYICTMCAALTNPRGDSERCSDILLQNQWLPVLGTKEHRICHCELFTVWFLIQDRPRESTSIH